MTTRFHLILLPTLGITCPSLSVHKSYILLAALKDEIGIKYLELAEELGKILTIRNSSILAHGFEPVKKDTYLKLLEITIKFIGVSKEVTPFFPKSFP